MNVQEVLNRIDFHIAKTGMSKEDFYFRSGISSASFSQWRTGQYNPSAKKLKSAAAVLNVPIEYLITGETDEKKPTPVSESGLEPERIKLMEWVKTTDLKRVEALLVMIEDDKK